MSVALKDRQKIMRQIEKNRDKRALVCYFNFDRLSDPQVSGLQTVLSPDSKEPLYRVLKETNGNGQGVDLCLYTRGGDSNAVWPLVNLIREFDADFEVLVPFRCHSGGTMICLGAKKIHMTPLAELSPIDPSTVNQFNPEDSLKKGNRLAISVEDVQSYRTFIRKQFGIEDEESEEFKEVFKQFVEKLTEKVHPLALGNVQRVHLQSKQLAYRLLALNGQKKKDFDKIVTSLTTEFFSHLHMIDRYEAQQILGTRVEHCSDELADLLENLLRSYEDSFELRRPFYLAAHLGDEPTKNVRFFGGAIESQKRSYAFETVGTAAQFTQLSPGVQVQVPPGQQMPLVPGLPREYKFTVSSQYWMHNKSPQGVTI